MHEAPRALQLATKPSPALRIDGWLEHVQELGNDTPVEISSGTHQVAATRRKW
jgi:hypothetical protein